jgi:hypothetical protein
MGIEEGEGVHAKGIHNIFSNTITEKFLNIKKVFPTQVQESSTTPKRLDQNRTSHDTLSKTTSTQDRQRILKSVTEKQQIKYTDKPIKITADFSTETLKARRVWSEVFWTLNENKFSPRLLYPAKLLLFKIDGAIKIFHIEQTLKQYMTTKPPLQKMKEKKKP